MFDGMRKPFLYSLILFGLHTTAVCTVTDSRSSGFLLYHEIGDHGGMCLYVRTFDVEDSVKYQPFLSRSCLPSNTAWRWSWHPGGMLMSLYSRNCLGVQKLRDSEKAALVPCETDALRSWSCGANYNLEISEFRMEHQLIYDGWQITGAHPILKPRKNADAAKWMVYTQNDVSEPVSLCDMPQVEFDTGKGIITAPGGKQVGVACLFPFIHKGKKVWKCINIPELGEHAVCAVSSDLDRNVDDWGVCPIHKRGTMSEWIPSPLCDRACGGGFLVLSRRCLYEPCDGQLSKTTQEECNTVPCSGDSLLTHGGSSHLFPVDFVYPVIGNTVYGKCSFPFVYKGSDVHECIGSLERPEKWCSLTENFDKHKKWGYCSTFYEGAWTSWSKIGGEDSSCSKTCGVGLLTVKRRCRFPPCKGQHTILAGRCNTQPCPECFDAKERDYEGITSTAVDGSICKKWAEASNLESESPLKNPSLRNNYCRLPLNERFQPYCYITTGRRYRDRSSGSWMYCDIPRCGMNYSSPGIPYTVPAHPYDDLIKYPTAGGSCIFPFQALNHERYDRCVSSKPAGREWCRTKNSTVGRDFAYCPSFFRGRWSEWKTAGECTERCGGGYLLSYRICLLPPCEGVSVKKESLECNMMPCTWSSPGLDDCFNGVGMSYAGNKTRTISGFECQHWSAQVPIEHSLYPSIMPGDMPELRNNFCRNPTPGIRSAPWCYSGNKIGSDRVKWEYCDVMKCPTKAGVIYAIPLNIPRVTSIDLGPSPCFFPFLAPNLRTKLETCQRTHIREIGTIAYCAVRNDTGSFARTVLDGLKTGQYAICPSTSQGTAGSWTKSTCSKTCGGGFWILKKKCLFPPCSEDTNIMKTLPCNTQRCLDCFVGDGANYHGVYNKTYKGEECANWKDTPDFDEALELEGNRCRNPDSRKSIPWCYSRGTLQETYCDPKHCVTGSIPYTIPQRGFAYDGAKCALPYKNGTDSYWMCQNVHGGYYCPIVEDVKNLEREHLGLCPPSYKGAWSSWKNTGFCSKHCGGGQLLSVRNCMYPPCDGVRKKYEEECNRHPCKWNSTIKPDMECYANWGYTYVGKTSRTFSGHACMNWRTKNPHNHGYTHDFAGLPLVHNFCRNPSYGSRYAPWCFTTNKAVRWEYCDIPRCPQQEGQIFTFLPESTDKTCQFPFVLDGRQIHECTSYVPDKREKRYMCGTTSKGVQFSMSDSWGYCPMSYRGTWSPWTVIKSDPCTAKCGGGHFRYKRKCCFRPCKGKIETMMGDCNVQPCNECYDDKKAGIEYMGTKTTTWNGVPCTKRRIGIEYTTKCRNTDDNNFNSPWCVSRDSRVGKVTCGLKHCTGSETGGRVAGFDFRDKKARFCDFPFQYGGKVYHSCAPRKNLKNFWCSFGASYGGPSNMGQCFDVYEGTWSSWTGPRCSKPCGRGENIYTRHCRYPPCQGSVTRKSGWCNTELCDAKTNCYNVSDRGASFAGPISISVTGKECSEWNDELKKKYYRSDLSHAQCRNLKGDSQRPWCVTNDGAYELCNIPTCAEPWSYPAASTIHVSTYAHHDVKLPCIFPFNYKGKRYKSCTNASPPKQRSSGDWEKKWCATVSTITDNTVRMPDLRSEFGYCKESHMGTWMSWSGAEKFCTKDCYHLARRYCLYEPCEGYQDRITDEGCTTSNCGERRWTAWTTWSSCQRCSTISVQTRSQDSNLVQSQSKLCDAVPDVNEHGAKTLCRVSSAKNDAEEEDIVKLLREYRIRIDSLSSAKSAHQNSFIAALAPMSLYFCFR